MPPTTLTDAESAYRPGDGPPLGLTLVYSQDLRRAGEQVVLAGRLAVLLGREEPLFPGGPLGDPRMSGRHAALAFDRGAWMVADRGSKNGTFVNGRRVTEAALAPGDVLRLGSTFIVFGPIALTPLVRPGAAPAANEGLMGGVSVALAQVRESIAMVGATDHTVLLLGESGSGKEVVARELHRVSGRPGPFLAVNCASLRGELLESELFGHVRGAFTGAQRGHDGLFQKAEQGTLLLDEVAEMEEPVQARLLRVLEARAVRPVGATEEVPIGTRVVAATNRDVEAAVRQGRLRADLYARLARWVIELPPLRARKEDIGVLARLVLAREEPGLDLAPELVAALLEAPWPLNVRGLVNVLTTARIAQPGVARLDLVPRVRSVLDAQASLTKTGEVSSSGSLAADAPSEPALAPRDSRPSEPGRDTRPAESGPRDTRPSELASREARGDDGAARPEPDVERVTEALRAHGGNLAAVARALDLSRQSLYRLLERLGLDPAAFRR